MLDLQEIKAREAKATKGPWEYLPGEFNYDDDSENHPGSIHQVENKTNRGWWIAAIEELFEEQTLANADFIAHAREDVPALIAEVERLREVAADAYGFIQYLYCHDSNYREAKYFLDKLGRVLGIELEERL